MYTGPAAMATMHITDTLQASITLTPRERAILALLAKGYSAKETAREIDVTPRVVESEIEKMRLKTGTRNRTHLIAYALKQGVVDPV